MKDKKETIGYYNKEEDSFLCRSCFEQLQTQGGYRRVKRKELEDHDYTCDSCGKKFTKGKWEISSKSRSSETYKILSGSWQILKDNKKLLWLTIIPLFIIGFILLATFGSLLLYYLRQGEFVKDALFYTSTFVGLVLALFIYFYFRAAIVYCVNRAIRKESFSIREALVGANKKVAKILRWTFVDSLTKSSLGALSSEATGYAGSISGMAGAVSWKLLTIFVVPILVIEETSVKEAAVKSFKLFTKVWGKASAFELSIGWIFAVVAIVGVFAIPIIALAFPTDYVVFALGAVYTLFLIVVLIAGIVVATLREIFIVVLYNYAEKGEIPEQFTEETMKGAFS